MKRATHQQYFEVFQRNSDGNEILQTLSALFYDVPSFDENNQYKTAYNEGRRSVIEFILRNIALAQVEPYDQEQEE
ncbi:Bbp19 family protein [Methylomonas koyamae]|uniref:Bbp19 family protein n=1 Tax=Methylomonas koyamae TaxID=702114 RepID=UPI0006D07651|nr:hypothetical protein [Methylomonas koyamae]BBL56996.1 hypothetical protein MKFW12EY_06090 [Methylomonas koyamae]